MKINIIGTGSGGNAIMFAGSVLLDAGLPYKHIKDHVKKISVVLLTHIHGDHFNKTTIRKLHIENSRIKFLCGIFLKQELLDIGLPARSIVVVDCGEKYKIGDVIFSPINLHHDVPNVGYRIILGEYKHIHATDTFNMDGIKARNYDSATLECNHDKNHALEIIAKKRLDGEFCHLERAIETHLSVDKAIAFIESNNIKKIYPVHVGSMTAITVAKKLQESGLSLEYL